MAVAHTSLPKIMWHVCVFIFRWFNDRPKKQEYASFKSNRSVDKIKLCNKKIWLWLETDKQQKDIVAVIYSNIIQYNKEPNRFPALFCAI